MSGPWELRVRVPGRVEVHSTVPHGSVVAVVGPNGAGKSSLVHALAGLVPSEGRLVREGTDLFAVPVQRRGVGLVFQDRRLFPHLSAVENVAFGPRARGVAAAEARHAAQELLELLGIGDLAGRRPAELSGGQAQRVAIARALVGAPELLLLDEPFTGLDVGVAAALRIELGRHLTDFGGTTFLVTHDAIDALTLADRVIVLDGGRVVQEGTPTEVAARPRSEHAARLVGLNVVPDGATLRAFPPSAVVVSPTPPHGSARHRWHGRVGSAAPHGDAIRVQVEIDQDAGDARSGEAGGPASLIADVTPAATRELDLVAGRSVWLTVKETAVTTYPAATSDGARA
ncbi:ABC transporter ATP-binding protein [Nocardioides sambongensis]|uniref:ABC transporter ATP-binding protein n=1 Tax=Nocardioides sambongensis TaxID=2589074 RepID=UPI00112E94EC|nr:ATP-binding cassette domain-containing protein [Nocardioides sambongensis]